MFQDTWREIAQKVTKEQDPEKLMNLVEELNGLLSQHEVKDRNSKNAYLDTGTNSIVKNYIEQRAVDLQPAI